MSEPRERQYEVFLRVAAQIQSTDDLEEKLDAIARGIVVAGTYRRALISLLDEEWNPTPHATTGETLRIRVWFDTREQVSWPNFTVDIHHENGTHVSGFSTSVLGHATGVRDVGQGYLDLVIPELPVNPGS